MATIDEKTKFPLSLIIAIGSGAVGICIFITTMFVQGVANSKDIEALKADQKEEMKVLNEIKASIIRIEEKIKK